MTDYVSLKVKFYPQLDFIPDLIADALAPLGYEMFENDDDVLTAYIPADIFDIKTAENELQNVVGLEKYNLDSEFIKGQDWNAEWEKHYFQPIVVDDLCVVHSSFHTNIPVAKYDIVIDPKMAFGTGHHSTTLCMMRYILESDDMKGKSVIDMGTGTGILAILSAMQGATDIVGIEIDRDAWQNALDNASYNNVDINFIHGDASSLKSLSAADFFFANINRNIILNDLEYYVEYLKPGGFMLLSGFYTEDIPMIEEAAEKYGIKKLEVKSDKNWVAVKFVKQ